MILVVVNGLCVCVLDQPGECLEGQTQAKPVLPGASQDTEL